MASFFGYCYELWVWNGFADLFALWFYELIGKRLSTCSSTVSKAT